MRKKLVFKLYLSQNSIGKLSGSAINVKRLFVISSMRTGSTSIEWLVR